ncbi:hypothetical protein, partial [Nitrolancea hollandica]|uniref:hypothetical protein n=1 Tax=Nitrolancea hollandica TaxID=1206749 RepID=UPI00058B6039
DIVTQLFSVGPAKPAALTRYRLREQILTRLDPVIRGTVNLVQGGNIVDEALIGGQDDYVGYWVLPHERHLEAGRPRRVIGYNGQTLILASPFDPDPEIGTEYLVSAIAPTEVDRAIETAIADLADVSRIPVRISGLVVDTDKRITLPDGLSHIYGVIKEDDKQTEILPKSWRMLPERRMQLENVIEGDTVTVLGFRPHTPLLWEDSTLDIAPDAVVARAEEILHASRAGGAAVDPDERLRRQIAARQVYEDARKRTAGRIPPNATPIIP